MTAYECRWAASGSTRFPLELSSLVAIKRGGTKKNVSGYGRSNAAKLLGWLRAHR